MKTLRHTRLIGRKDAALKHPCDGCGKPFERGEILVVITEQVNWFRGDDQVRFYHQKCEP